MVTLRVRSRLGVISLGGLKASRSPDILIACPLRICITIIFSNNYRNSPGELIAGFRLVYMATVRQTRHAGPLLVPMATLA